MAFSAGAIEATLTLDRSPFQQGLDEAKAEAQRFADSRYEARVGISGDAKAQLADIDAQAQRLGASSPTVRVGTEGDTEAKTSLSGVEEQARRLGTDRPTIKVVADTVAASTDLASVLAEAKRIEAEKTFIKLDADKTLLEAKLAETQATLDRLASRPATVGVKAATEEAQAKLATLQAQMAAIDRKQIQILVDSSQLDGAGQAASDAGNAAEAAGGQLSAMAAGIMAAFPPASAAVLGLSGALALAVVPMATIQLGMSGIQNAALLAVPALVSLQGAASDAFQQGLAPALNIIGTVFPALNTGLADTATSLSGLATQVSVVAASAPNVARLGTVLSGVNTIIDGLGPGISSFTQNVIELGQMGVSGLQPLGAIMTQIGSAWHSVIAQLTATGQGTSAISSLVLVLGEAGSALAPVVQLGAELMAALGPSLVGALGAVNAVLGPIASVFGSLPGPMQTVVGAAAAVGIAMRMMGTDAAAGATATAAAGAEAAASAGRFSGVRTAFSDMGMAYRTAVTSIEEDTGRVGGAMTRAVGGVAAGVSGFKSAAGGLVGALGGPWGLAITGAIVGLGFLGSAMADNTKKSQDLAQAAQDYGTALSRTGGVIDSGVTKLAAQKAEQDGLFTSAQQLGVSTQDVTQAIVGQGTATQDLVGKLQAVVAAHTTASVEAKRFGDTGQAASKQIDAEGQAAQDLIDKIQAQAQAFKDGTVAQSQLAKAMGDTASAFGDQATAISDATRTTALYAVAIGDVGDNTKAAGDKIKEFAAAMQSASDGPRSFLDAQTKANEVLTNFGTTAGRLPATLVGLNGTIDTTTKTGQELAKAMLSAASANDSLYGATLLSAQQSHSQADSLAIAAAASVDYRQKLIDQAVAHGITRSAAEAMVSQYDAIPKDIVTQFQQPGMVKAIADAEGLTSKITSIPGDKSIVVSSLTDDAKAKLEALGLTVQKLPNGQILITADPTQAKAVIAATTNLATQQIASFTLDANPNPATGKVNGAVHFANGQVGTLTLDGNPTLVNGKTTTAVHFADGSKGTITLDGNPDPATGKINATVTYGNGRHSTIIVDANADAAYGTINGIPRDIWITAHVTASSNVNSAGGLAAGGILRPMADGGIIANADGNNLTPMAGGIAQTVAPNTWRIIGDNLTVPESYIPHDGSDRSRSILAQTATDMGYGLVPQGLMEALRASAGPSGSDGVATPSSAGGGLSAGNAGVVEAVREVASRLEKLEQSGSAAQVTAKVDELLTELKRSGAGAQITVEDHSGDPTETANRTLLALRLR